MGEALLKRQFAASGDSAVSMRPAAAAPRGSLWGDFAVVQDRHGNTLSLTNGARASLIGTWVALVVGLMGMVGTVWHFGEQVSDSIYQAGVASARREMEEAQEAADRHHQTEEFRDYQIQTNDRIEALTSRIAAMEEAQLRAKGLPIPPEPPQAKAHAHRQNGL